MKDVDPPEVGDERTTCGAGARAALSPWSSFVRCGSDGLALGARDPRGEQVRAARGRRERVDGRACSGRDLVGVVGRGDDDALGGAALQTDGDVENTPSLRRPPTNGAPSAASGHRQSVIDSVSDSRVRDMSLSANS